MKSKILLLLVLFGCSNDKLHTVCPLECFDGPQNKKNVGICKSGKPLCDEDNRPLMDPHTGKIACVGQVLPDDWESCDNLDNDCDGEVDEGMLIKMNNISIDYPCFVYGECADGRAVCANGEWVCQYADDVELPEEVSCDGKDNDCDGQIDDNVYSSLPLNERLCYSGNPTTTAAIPPCHAGVLDCINSEVLCVNEKTPSIEMCDGIDNDCDGIVDDTNSTLSTIYDIVFVMDTSGSMCPVISAVGGACNQFAEQFDGNENIKFALVSMSKYNPPVQIDTDFSDFSTIRNRLLSLTCGDSAEEASLDSMLLTCNSSNPLGLSWRDNSNKLVFYFTDEEPQTYTVPETTSQDIISACLGSYTLPYIWANDMAFSLIVNSANGQYFTLTSDADKLLEDMNSIMITLCQ